MNMIFELGSAIASPNVRKSEAFYKKYERLFQKQLQAGHGVAPAYESVYILVEAIERAGSLDPDAIVAELQKTDRRGVMGRIKFDAGHQTIFGFDPKETAVAACFQWTQDGKTQDCVSEIDR